MNSSQVIAQAAQSVSDRSIRVTRRSVQRIISVLNEIISRPCTAINANEAKYRLAELMSNHESYLRLIRLTHNDITETEPDKREAAEDLIQEEEDRVSDTVSVIHSRVTAYIDQFDLTYGRRSFVNNEIRSEPNVKLPKINVPKFDGKKENFLNFAAMFESLVHDNLTLSKVQKLNYLQEACINEPKDLIRNFPMSDLGYDQAWELLQSRYRDLKSIIRIYLNNLFNIEKMKSVKDVSRLLVEVDKALKGLEACGESPAQWSTILSYMVSERLDETTFIDFEKTLTTNRVFPSFDQLHSFLENLASVGNRQADVKAPPKAVNSSRNSPKLKKRSAALVTTSSPGTFKRECIICKQSHLLIDCPEFKAKSPKDRYFWLKGKSLCLNCFNSGHSSKECQKPQQCKWCKLPHHSMLHFDERKSNSAANSTQSTSTGSQSVPSSPTPSTSSASSPDSVVAVTGLTISSQTTSLLSTRKSSVILPTAVVTYVCGDKTGEMRVLLDSGSQLNLLTQSFVTRSGIPTSKNSYIQKVAGVSGADSTSTRIATLLLESRHESFSFTSNFNVMEHRLPYVNRNLQLGSISDDLRKYKLADPVYYDSIVSFDDVDALLGIEAYNRCVSGETHIIGSVCLRNTKLGWTVSSSGMPDVTPTSDNPDTMYCGLTTERIDQRLQKFWEVESIPEPVKAPMEHVECDKHFESTFKFDDNGQFILKLPFKRDPICIQGNFNQALAYSRRIENRLSEPVADLYEKFMAEYLELGHMTLISNLIQDERHFIPHHAVMKLSSTTTKLRVVFNASSKTSSNVSLNDTLMVGPSIQPELFDTLLRFRRYRHAVSADITKFYRCILIDQSDRKYQSIVWKGQAYELNTVTYGTGPASFQAAKCLEILARKVEKTQPLVCHILRNCFYMDDAMFGADSADQLIELRRVLHDTLASVKFDLRKYQSNSPVVLRDIPPDLIETKLTKTFGGDDSLLVLGLSWVPENDVFRLKTNFEPADKLVTKRTILSAVSKLFDPLGLASPVSIRGKLLFQRLWRLSLNWDDPLPPEIIDQFRVYLKDLNDVHQIVYPRFVGCHKDDRLVGFSDASEQAYCAVVYLVTIENNERRSHLYCSKTRVAPVKQLTIPQLELQAATLLCDLVDRVRKLVTVRDENVYLFTDSTIVLSWLARPPSDWKIFVRNRVDKIISRFTTDYWSHVSGKSNPADLATRGLSTNQLTDSSLWLFGPEFIIEDEITRVLPETDNRCDTYLSKSKTSATLFAQSYSQDVHIIESYSSYEKLIRCYATVYSVVRRWRSRSGIRPPVEITSVDLNAAERYVIRCVQQTIFQDDYARLSSSKRRVKRSSRLRQLNPFLDDFGLIRSSTRLQNSNFSFDRRNPVILPARHHITTILIRYIHERYSHATRQFILSHLSVKYLFVGGISPAIKAVLRKCVTCCRYNALTITQQMADLPADRVTARSPFEIVGVDFAGAFTVKCDFHRTTKFAKAYAAIFVCFSTRAVHIETVTSLSTEDFLNSLKCFIARRGIPATIYSDNGTNFRGANNYLSFDSPDIRDYAISQRINWKFNPPYTPHRGGIWEAAVKSAKRFLPIVTKGQTFTYEELRIFFTQTEAILNSRPLAYRYESATSEILTPAHFLIGKNLTSLPEPVDRAGATVKLTARYHANQQRINRFWKVWHTDYLNQLRNRSKWLDPQPNFTSGQIVLYRQPSNVPNSWPLAMIQRCFPDQKGLIRTVEILYDRQLKIVPVNHLVNLHIPGIPPTEN